VLLILVALGFNVIEAGIYLMFYMLMLILLLVVVDDSLILAINPQ
jgi:hypothetical protein